MAEKGRVSLADRKKATELYLAQAREKVSLGPFCGCGQMQYPHNAHTTELPIFDYHRSLRYVPIERTEDRRPIGSDKGGNRATKKSTITPHRNIKSTSDKVKRSILGSRKRGKKG